MLFDLVISINLVLYLGCNIYNNGIRAFSRLFEVFFWRLLSEECLWGRLNDPQATLVDATVWLSGNDLDLSFHWEL